MDYRLHFLLFLKNLTAPCFLVLVFAQTGYFSEGQCFIQRSIHGVPPLNGLQIQQVRDAIVDGRVEAIQTALAAGGPIMRGNSSFSPIVNLTDEQICALEPCFESPVPLTLGRRKRDAPGQQVNLACDGYTGVVLYTVDQQGNSYQVIVDDLPSQADCVLSAGCNGCCCTVPFFANSIGIILTVDPDVVATQFEVQHCTCCNA